MSAVANVAVNLDSRGVPAKLKQIADRGKEVDRSLNGAAAATTKAGREFKSAGNAASQAAGGFNKLGKAIGGIITAAAALQALKFTIVSTAELETQTRSLKVLTGSLETAQKIVQQLQDIGAVTPFTSTELIDTAKRLSAFGVETEKLVDTTRRLGDVAGATGADLGGIATAFGQIQAKGRLQGEELLQLQERGIDLQSELQRMYGLTGEEFRKALEKGRFSAEAVDVALQNLTNTGGKYANGAIAQSDTLAGKFSTLQDGITRTAQAIGQILSPALQTILEQAIGVVNSINNALAAGRRIQQFGIDAQQRNRLFQQAGKEAEEIASLRGGGRIDPAVFTRLRDERFKDLIERYGYETGQIQIETQAPTIGTPKIPELLGGNGNGEKGKTKKPEKSLQQQVAELNAIVKVESDISNARLDGNKILEAQLEAYKRQLEIKHQSLAPELEALELERNGIQLNETLAELEKERLGRFDQFLIKEDERIEKQMGIIKNYQEETRMLELQAVKGQEFVDKLKQIKTLVEEGGMSFAQAFDEVNRRAAALKEKVDPMKDVFEQMASTVATTFSSAFDAAVDGTKNLGEALQDLAGDLLKTIGKMLIMYGIAQALGAAGGGSKNPQGILSFLARGFGYRANGGPVSPGGTYMVGERGPELLTMTPSGGYVTSNSTSQAAMDRYSSGNTRGGSISVNYNVTEINGMKFVTEDQFRAGISQAAKQGAEGGFNRTMTSLKNSRSQRSKLGIGR